MSGHRVAFHNRPLDVSGEFNRQENLFFIAQGLEGFDPHAASGAVRCTPHGLKPRLAFNEVSRVYEPARGWEHEPPADYAEDLVALFSLAFVSERTVRLRLSARSPVRGAERRGGHPGKHPGEPPLMLATEPDDRSACWRTGSTASSTTYGGRFGSVAVEHDPWRVGFSDAPGRLLTRTRHPSDAMCLLNTEPIPFSFARCASDLSHRLAASFSLSPGEKLFGCGESFTRLDKRGQRLVLWAHDALGAQTAGMYKPVPFFMSSRGYGVFVHTATPLTLDLGHSNDGAAVLYLGDGDLDLFFFFGRPKEVLSEYTALTGRGPTPPPWSFGLWMGGRNRSSSEEGVRDAAAKLRRHRVPCDVIHLDAGWSEQEGRCDFEFSQSRFADPARMLGDLKKEGFRVSLWQAPYFAPENPMYEEAIAGGYAVFDADSDLPTENVVVDFASPEAARWYGKKLARLLEMGVAAVKTDFGEGAPLSGVYSSGRTGFREHNLYPLRYNKTVAEVTEDATGERIVWARSAWAGGQRYPVHWAGDAESTDSAMAATLRAGLSLGLCGFSFWSHDAGGFASPSPDGLYRRWLAFGALSSHLRCHGEPPTEPWEYGRGFLESFRRTVEMRYRLLPYIYSQASICSREGYPMLRALFFEYPEDPTSWLVEDEYMLGGDLLVAPLFEEGPYRDVYLPPGIWIDYQTGRAYRGGEWHRMRGAPVPVVMLVRDGAVIPHAGLAQSTDAIDWAAIELRAFGAEATVAEGPLCLPDDDRFHVLRLERGDDACDFALAEDPLRGRVEWTVWTVPRPRNQSGEEGPAPSSHRFPFERIPGC